MDKTKAWRLYENGKGYNSKLKPDYFNTVDTNWAFFNGDQWRNIETEYMPKPVFNIIKRVITFLVASLTSSKTKIHFEPLTGTEGLDQFDTSKVASAQVNNLLEKFKMDIKIKDALFDAAVTGDAAAHFYYDTDKKPYGRVVELSNGQKLEGIKGEICMEIVDGTNVFFGNPNNTDVQSQPYIIVSGRDMVSNLRKEKEKYARMQQEQQQQQPTDGDLESVDMDNDTRDMAGDNGKIEIDADENSNGKALYIIVYRKGTKEQETFDELGNVTGVEEVETIFATKSVEKTYIYENIDTGMTTYPVAWLNWEKVKNSYHGRGICTGILPNQIFINRMFAMVMYHLMQTAFPKAVYNADIIEEWTNEIGSAIPVFGAGLETNIKNIAGYLEPAQMSNQIVQVLELAMQYTKDTLGINDTSLGNVTPDNTSAIIAVQKSAAIPLENPKANLYQWIEDIGNILFDMMGTYYGTRPLPMDVKMSAIDPMTGQPKINPMTGQVEEQVQKQVISFDFSVLKELWLNVRADVGESSYWSEIASNQTLTNLLTQGLLDVIQFLERTPDELIPDKEKLIEELKIKQAQMAAQAAAEQQAAAAAAQDGGEQPK